jgi:hypothetical protein
MSVRESPIYAKSYDLLKWILPSTVKFPKHQRFVLARQIEEAAFGFHRAIVRAGREHARSWMPTSTSRCSGPTSASPATCATTAWASTSTPPDSWTSWAGLSAAGGGRAGAMTTAASARTGRDAGAGYRPARRVLEQQPDQPACDEPQQQHARQPQHEYRVPLRE